MGTKMCNECDTENYCEVCSVCTKCTDEWISDQDKKIKDLKAELLIAENALTNARADLHGTRQHVTEINQDG